jgi:hypothetical protein
LRGLLFLIFSWRYPHFIEPYGLLLFHNSPQIVSNLTQLNSVHPISTSFVKYPF